MIPDKAKIMRQLRFNFSVLLVIYLAIPTCSWAQLPVVWADLVGVSVNGAVLSKNTTTGWNAGAASMAKLGIGRRWLGRI